MAKLNAQARKLAGESVWEFIVDCENGFYDAYVRACFEEEVDPSDLMGEKQIRDVYAKALIALGLEFPTS